MSEENRHDPLAKVATARRDFLKKIAIAAAFAAPTVATFSLDGMRKKAFAQAAYDQPQIVSLLVVGAGQAEVNFNQPMNTGNGTDLPRTIYPGCREIWFETGGVFAVTGCTWDGNAKQVITFNEVDCESVDTLNVTYNWGDCGSATKFVGANGLELVPYSGSVTVSGSCS